MNSDGIRTADEPGIAGAVVEVLSSTDAIVGNADDVSHGVAITDANGRYSFSDLPEGLSFYEKFHVPAGYSFTAQNVGSGASLDSDCDTTGTTGLFTILAEENDNSHSAGVFGSTPDFGFAFHVGSAGQCVCADSVVTDAAGNSYVTGGYEGTVDFDPGPGVYNLTSADSYDVFAAKYTSTGALVWARSMGGGSSDRGMALAVGADGSVCIAGTYHAPSSGFTAIGLSSDLAADFDPGPGAFYLPSAGTSDQFLCKLDADGNFVWASRCTGVQDVAVASDGSVLVASNSGVSKLDSAGTTVWSIEGTACHIAVGANGDIFAATATGISKLDSLGNVVWSKDIAASPQIAAGPNGSVCYTIGVVVSELDSAGDVIWTTTLGSSVPNTHDIAVGNDGSVFVVTRAESVIYVPYTASSGFTAASDLSGTIGIITYPTYPVNLETIQAYKLGGDGHILWNRPITGSFRNGWTYWSQGTDFHSTDIAVAASPDGSAVIAGAFRYPMTISTPQGESPSISNTGYEDMLVAKIGVLNVTINRAADQANLTTDCPVHFTVVFSEEVSDFAADDVVLDGTAPDKQVTKITGSGTTYDVDVTASGYGTILASIAAGRVHNAAGVRNTASTGTDNAVHYVAPQPEIAVFYNGAVVSRGQTVPIDLGTAIRGGAGTTATITICNDGLQTLTLNTPFASTSHFIVGQPVNAILAAGESTSFTITLDTRAIWSGSEKISFGNNDADNSDGVENPFSFLVNGTVNPSPAVLTILDGTTAIPAEQSNLVDFGSVVQGRTGTSKTFTIRNDGDEMLVLTTPLASTSHFTVGQPAKTSLAAGETTTFVVTLNSAAQWQGTEYVAISSEQGAFDLCVTGTVTAGLVTAPGYTPQMIRTAYGIDAIVVDSLVGDGAGQTIAIIGIYDNPKFVSSNRAGFEQSDLHQFDVAFGLPDPPSFHKLDQNGGTDYPSVEPTAGVSGWAIETAMDVEWAHAIAPKANIVLVEANSPLASDFIAAIDTARHLPGVSVISISGGWREDQLGADGETMMDSLYTTPTGHKGVTFVASAGDTGAAGAYPGFSPNVVGVGGTALAIGYNGVYVDEIAWADGSGGTSLYEKEPSCQRNVQNSGSRQAPDVAFCAYPDWGVAVYDSYNCGGVQPWALIGGTSLGAPCWAGLIAIANQIRVSKGLGTLDGPSQTLPALYALPVDDFHDITSGGNSLFAAGIGYDQVTGLGTPVANKLVPDLAALRQATPPTVSGVSPVLTGGAQVAGITQIILSMSGTVLGASDAASYELRGAGADRLLGTDDDVVVPLNVYYSGEGATVTLTFAPLKADSYRLTVHDTVTDLHGNKLDGNGDGKAGGDWVDGFVLPNKVLPTVAAVTPVLTGTLSPDVTQISIMFSEPVHFPSDASLFDLRGAGPDGLLGTSDDTIVSLDSSDSGTTYYLQFSSLLEGLYRLTAHDVMVDLVGNKLDGDGDGVPGGDWIRDFVVMPDATDLFSAPVTFNAGNPHTSIPCVTSCVAVADFNGDNASDMAVLDIAGATVGILLGDGKGGFSAARIFDIGCDQPTQLLVADFNGDGKSDLAVTGRKGNMYYPTFLVNVLFGDGDGGFASPLAVTAQADVSHGIAVGDFNKDGDADLVVTNVDGSFARVFLSDGNGEFQPGKVFGGNPANGWTRLIVGDFNNDGNLDIVAGRYVELRIALGDGTGGFSDVMAWDPGNFPFGNLISGDFNEDGKLDLALAAYGCGSLTILGGDGDGGFSTIGSVTNGDISSPDDAAQGDFNGDGHADIVESDGRTLIVFLGDGAGGLVKFGEYFTGGRVSGGVELGGVAVGDFNADGHSDIAASILPTSTVGVLLNAADRQAIPLVSPHAVTFDIAPSDFGTGAIVTSTVQGANSPFDDDGRLLIDGKPFQTSPAASSIVDGGQSLLTGDGCFSGLRISRKITAPNTGDEDFVRTVDSFANPTSSPITATVQIIGNLGSNSATTVFATSDGDKLVEPSDQWIGTDGGNTPAVIHYIHGPAGLRPSTAEVIGDNIRWTYNLTVPAGQTVRLAYYTIVGTTRQEAIAAADALVRPDHFAGQATAYLNDSDVASLANFQFPSVAITATLNTRSPLTGDVLTVTAAKADTTGTPVTLTYVWMVNGVPKRTFTSVTALTDTFDLSIAGNGNRGDTITVSVTPDNGIQTGTTVTDTATVLNASPTDITLSKASVMANSPKGTTVGTLCTRDLDGGDTFIYSLVTGTGSDDNASFMIVGDKLQTADGFHHEAKEDCSIRVRSTDFNGQWTEKAFTIRVATPIGQDTIGLFAAKDSAFLLRNSNDSGYADEFFGFGPANAGWIPLAGDWNDDGVTTVGLYNPKSGTFFLKNDNSTGYADACFSFGPANAGWVPIVGDWNGDGTTTVGLYEPGTSNFFLKNTNTTGYADVCFSYGLAKSGLTPIVGDWNGDGTTTVGLYNPSTSLFLLRNENSAGYANECFSYGPGKAGFKPLVGDWNANGTETVGLYNPASSVFFLRNDNSAGYADLAFGYGPANAGLTPLVGDWDGPNRSSLLAADDAIDGNGAGADLTDAALQPLVEAAIARWAATGLSADSVTAMKSVRFSITDLPSSELGVATKKAVTIDRDAAGHGWFVDSTPHVDEEFVLSSNGAALLAVDAEAVDKIDLLTVVEHELGHIVGFDDIDTDTEELMCNALAVGTRRLV